MTTHVSAVSRNLALNAAFDVCNSGFLRVYSGSAPATADTALSGNTLLAEISLGATAFGAASAGAKALSGVPLSDSSANATGTASFFRLYKTDGTTCVFQGSVGTSGADLNLNSVSIVATAPVEVTSLSLSFAA